MIKTFSIGGKNFKVEMANTWYRRFRGLSGRKDMGNCDGMIFVFPWRARWRMCMRGMRFPLDFVWIDETRDAEHKIIAINYFVQPGKVILRPPRRVKMVLELSAGKSHGLI